KCSFINISIRRIIWWVNTFQVIKVFHIHFIGNLCFIHVKGLNVLSVRGVVPVMHDIILNLTSYKSSPLYKYESRSVFLLFEVCVVLKAAFVGINLPTSSSGSVFGRITTTSKPRKRNQT